jgi:aryl-alcohol dehydrogenase-like predicted oxidoreductase
LHQTAEYGPPVDDEKLYDIVDALDAVAEETGRTVPQIALNWLIGRPTVASVIIGARNEAQLRQNLGAVGWSLSKEHGAARQGQRRHRALSVFPLSPAGGFARLNPPLV